MRRSYREQLIAAVTFIAGLYFFLEFVLPAEVAGYRFGKYHEQISNGFIVVGAMAIGLGLINLLLVHGSAILKTRKGWPFSAALLAGLGIMMYFEGAAFVQGERAVGAWKEIAQLTAYAARIKEERDTKPIGPRIEAAVERIEVLQRRAEQEDSLLYVAEEAKRREFQHSLGVVADFFVQYHFFLEIVEPTPLTSAQLESFGLLPFRFAGLAEAVAVSRTFAKEAVDEKIENSVAKRGARFLYLSFFVPLGAAMFSLLAFYVATAAYRTFRIRSAEAGIMMAAALVVMLGQIPHGPMYVSPKLVPIRLWLLEQLSTPAFRAIFFGAAIAGLAMAVRMWLSLERSPLDSED